MLTICLLLASADVFLAPELAADNINRFLQICKKHGIINLDKSSGFLHSFQWPETFAQRQNFSVAPLGSAAHRAGPPMGFGGPVYGPSDCSKQDFQPFWYMTFAANFYLSYPISSNFISSSIFFIYISISHSTFLSFSPNCPSVFIRFFWSQWFSRPGSGSKSRCKVWAIDGAKRHLLDTADLVAPARSKSCRNRE